MPRRKSAAQASEFWKNGMGNAGPKIKAGVDSVTVSPGQKAAAKKDQYVLGVQQQADNWARKVAAVPLEDWKQRTRDGADRVASGAAAKQGKYETAVEPVFAHMDSVLSVVDSMPTDSLDQRIARSSEFQRRMAAFKRSR